MDGRSHTAGLILLFPRGKRPDRAAIMHALSNVPNAQVSHDPGESHADGAPLWTDDSGDALGGDAWLELLIDGLTFDLVGLAPGPGLVAPAIEFRIDFGHDQDLDDFELVGLAPGPHLSGGMRSLIVVRTMASLGCALSRRLETIEGFYWLPSRAVTGVGFFRSTVDSWIEGGPFPALGLTAFRNLRGGAIESVGLEFFTGQEVRVCAELAIDPAAATRLAMRLVHQLALYGPVAAPEQVTGPDGAMLQIEPIESGQVVLVRAM